MGFECKYLRYNIYVYSFAFAMTLIQNKIMRLQNPCGISIIDAVYWIIPDLRCQKRLWILFFCGVNHNLKKRRFLRFLRFLAFTFERTSQETKARGL